MKVTKTREEYKNEKQRKAQIRSTALTGCDICPCCGESRDSLSYIKEGIYDKGIHSSIINKDWYGKKYEREKGILYQLFAMEKKRYWQVNCFSCLTCGAEWESDPYTYDK